MPDTAAADWITDFFTDIYTDSDLELRDTRTTDAMVRCVTDALRLPAGASLLDLACGTGRHSVPLAAAGYTVTGVDLMEPYLERARARALAAGSTARFVRADMRDLGPLPQGGFDAVVSLHTSFGFFDTEEADLAVLEQVRGVLSPGGRLLIDVMNRDWFLSQSGESFGVGPGEFIVRNFEVDGPVTHLYEERFSPLTSRIRWHIRTAGTAPERSATADYRVYSAHELCRLLDRAGFQVTDVYGDYDLSPFHVHAPHLIITARRA
ncbi:methyltransferase domain-containing protein [Streptomyces sp. ISL-66]|uniref:class I SAM-dependent methyltransferase n=1 Tax=Streptomyces sp. ISL-66 TaxID=2819186 RepID=UPI001BE5203B|nr:methyltransferase domain-containing protein [Streptomyces sp. ISL-66]MBT2468891.1 methyltransferase domain-containing protein [Streptomyces sp. ISL-66]